MNISYVWLGRLLRTVWVGITPSVVSCCTLQPGLCGAFVGHSNMCAWCVLCVRDAPPPPLPGCGSKSQCPATAQSCTLRQRTLQVQKAPAFGYT
jgi:hypothetical protein